MSKTSNKIYFRLLILFLTWRSLRVSIPAIKVFIPKIKVLFPRNFSFTGRHHSNTWLFETIKILKWNKNFNWPFYAKIKVSLKDYTVVLFLTLGNVELIVKWASPIAFITYRIMLRLLLTVYVGIKSEINH